MGPSHIRDAMRLTGISCTRRCIACPLNTCATNTCRPSSPTWRKASIACDVRRPRPAPTSTQAIPCSTTAWGRRRCVRGGVPVHRAVPVVRVVRVARKRQWVLPWRSTRRTTCFVRCPPTPPRSLRKTSSATVVVAYRKCIFSSRGHRRRDLFAWSPEVKRKKAAGNPPTWSVRGTTHAKGCL